MALLTQFSTLLFLAVGAALGQCPPREDILPCSCTLSEYSWDNFNIKVLCWKVDDVADVRKALQSVKGIQRVAVEFKDSRLGSVPSDLFKGLRIIDMTFDHCALKRIGDTGRSALEGLEDSIEKLRVEFSFSKDNALRFLNVSRLRVLETLEIKSDNVNEVGNEWFSEGPANLSEISFMSNGITRLGDRVFAALTNFQKLRISYNNIKTLNRSMFPLPASYLWTIHLNTNEISSLPEDLFSDMPELKHVFLSDNALQSIPEVTWKPVWSRMEYLFFDGNPLNCDAEIEWTFKERRPNNLQGKCVSPDERKGVYLRDIIDDKQKDT